MSGETALVVAYGVIWVFLFAYVVRLGQALRALQADAHQLRERLDNKAMVEHRT